MLFHTHDALWPISEPIPSCSGFTPGALRGIMRDGIVFSASSAETIAKALNRTTFAVRHRASTLRLPLRKIAKRRSLI
jgi:hypothetical protein